MNKIIIYNQIQYIRQISGIKVLFKVAVVLFRCGLRTSDQLKEFNDFHSIVTRLKNLPEEIMSEDFLIQKVSQRHGLNSSIITHFD